MATVGFHEFLDQLPAGGLHGDPLESFAITTGVEGFISPTLQVVESPAEA